MCYYNRVIVPIEQAFQIGDFTIGWPEELRDSRPMQSGFEFGDWPIIIWSESGQKPEMVRAHWEFLASWTRSLKAAEASRHQYTTLNAVGENLLESRLYKEAAMQRRCIVLSSGFYEWRQWKLTGAKKDIAIPYFIFLPEKPVFAMAGIWQPWTDQETGEHLISFAIVTTTANELMCQVHNKKKRMPLILDDPNAAKWLQPGIARTDIEHLVAFQYDARKMKTYTIAKDFRNAIDPLTAEEYDFIPAIQ